MDSLTIMDRFTSEQPVKAFYITMVQWYVDNQNEIGFLLVPDNKSFVYGKKPIAT